jgi:hypothetical protein
MDHLLAEDVRERLAEDGRLEDVEVILPLDGDEGVTPGDIGKLARDTIQSRLVIFDVRRQTLPRLQEPFNRVAGFNRGDLNDTFYTLVIGDGPVNLFKPDSRMEVFASHLAKFRLDYGPAAYFFDPFVHYDLDELANVGIDRANTLPTEIPRRLAHGFVGDEIDVRKVRRHFRAANKPPEKRARARRKRIKALAQFYKSRLKKVFPEERDRWEGLLTNVGCSITGESLRLHLYPLFFTDWVCDVLAKARTGIPLNRQRGRAYFGDMQGRGGDRPT